MPIAWLQGILIIAIVHAWLEKKLFFAHLHMPRDLWRTILFYFRSSVRNLSKSVTQTLRK